MYEYEKMKQQIFTEAGQREFLKVRDEAQRMLKLSGGFTMGAIIGKVCGDSWQIMAYVDRLVELGEIQEIPQRCSGQDRVFVSRR